MSQLVHKMSFSRCQALFYLRRINPVLKRCQIPKNFDYSCSTAWKEFKVSLKTLLATVYD